MKKYFWTKNRQLVKKKSYQLLGELVDQVSREYNLQVDNRDNLIWHLHNTTHLHRQELSTEFILFDQKKGTTIKNFQNIFPHFVSEVKEEWNTI